MSIWQTRTRRLSTGRGEGCLACATRGCHTCTLLHLGHAEPVPVPVHAPQRSAAQLSLSDDLQLGRSSKLCSRSFKRLLPLKPQEEVKQLTAFSHLTACSFALRRKASSCSPHTVALCFCSP